MTTGSLDQSLKEAGCWIPSVAAPGCVVNNQVKRATLQEKAMPPPPVLLPGKSRGRRGLVGCGPWGLKESDTTERLHFHFSLSCIGEGNGNLLQCSCLENPRDREACWAAVYGVVQSRTQLKRLSSSSSSSTLSIYPCSILSYIGYGLKLCGKEDMILTLTKYIFQSGYRIRQRYPYIAESGLYRNLGQRSVYEST